MMGQRTKERKVSIDQFISSSANRALSTAVDFAAAYSVQKNSIKQVKKLYHAAPAVFYEVIAEIDNSIETAAIFSHNPGITEFVNELTATKVDNMPTCAVFAVSADITHWKDYLTTGTQRARRGIADSLFR